MRRNAVVLFTLDPLSEGQRKPLGLPVSVGAALFKLFIHRVERVVAATEGADLLVASPRAPATSSGRFLAQRGKDPEESLRLAVEDAFRLGYRRVVVVGNDAPELSPIHLREAFTALERRAGSAVIAPAPDGGYALLGLNAPCPSAFSVGSWGTGHAAVRVSEALLRAGFGVDHLGSLEDIDGSVDLGRLLTRLRKSRRADAEALLALIVEVLLGEPGPRAQGVLGEPRTAARRGSSPRAPPASS